MGETHEALCESALPGCVAQPPGVGVLSELPLGGRRGWRGRRAPRVVGVVAHVTRQAILASLTHALIEAMETGEPTATPIERLNASLVLFQEYARQALRTAVVADQPALRLAVAAALRTVLRGLEDPGRASVTWKM